MDALDYTEVYPCWGCGMWGKRGREQSKATRSGNQIPDELLADPTMALMVAMETVKRADDPVERAQAQMMAAEALSRIGGSRPQASYLVGEAISAFARHLPATRTDLANAHYFAADLARGSDWPLARRHYEAALPYVRRDEPMLWVAVNEGLAAALVRGPGGDEPDAQERSLALYLDIISIEPPAVPAGHWALTAEGLALTFAERHRGKNADNWANAFKWARRAVERSPQDADNRGALTIYARASIAFGTGMLFRDPPAAADWLKQIGKGAEVMDMFGRSGDESLTSAFGKLATAASSTSREQWPGAALLMSALPLLEGVDDRRGLVELHILLAMDPDVSRPGERIRHVTVAEGLLSPHDDEYLQRLVAAGRAFAEGRWSPDMLA